MSYHHHSVAR